MASLLYYAWCLIVNHHCSFAFMLQKYWEPDLVTDWDRQGSPKPNENQIRDTLFPSWQTGYKAQELESALRLVFLSKWFLLSSAGENDWKGAQSPEVQDEGGSQVISVDVLWRFRDVIQAGKVDAGKDNFLEQYSNLNMYISHLIQ